MTHSNNITELMLSNLDVNSNYIDQAFGRFDLMPVKEKEGSPIYRHAYSKEIQAEKEFLLYR